jgi:hypothetical protein
VAERLAASQEGLSSMELVNTKNRMGVSIIFGS